MAKPFWHSTYSGTYLGEIAPMPSTEIAALSKHMTPINFITIKSTKKSIISLQVAPRAPTVPAIP